MEGTIKKSGFRLDQFFVTNFAINRKPVDQGEVEFNISPYGVVEPVSKTFTVQLTVDVKDHSGSFDIHLIAVGIFEFKDMEDPENISNYFYVNAPAIMFPYVRSYISTVTALSGLNAVNLPVMRLTKLEKALRENTDTIVTEDNSELGVK